MNIKMKRRFSAWILLSVLLPMLLVSSLHVHKQMPASQYCTECVNHTPHNGHISLDTFTVHECVLCQFVQLSYLKAVVWLVVMTAVLKVFVASFCPSAVSVVAVRVLSLRAPPFVW